MTFVCGVIQHRSDSYWDKGRWGWPFGRVDLRENEIAAYPVIFSRRFEVHIPYSQITWAVVRRYRFLGGQVRLERPASPSGDVSVVTVNGNYVKIAELLREKGVHVRDG
jgi:hypothetical protein